MAENASDLWQWKRISVELLIITAIGLVLGALGPFGTFEMPAPLRLAYWIGFIIVGYAIFRPIRVVGIWLSEQTHIPIWATTVLTTAVGALPLTFAINFVANGMRSDAAMLSSNFALLYLQCFGIGIAIFVIMRLIFEPMEGKAEPSAFPIQTSTPSASPPVFTKLHNRLQPGFGNILALGMEDHYVRVFGTQRQEMLLLRFSDALNELDEAEGLQVHRSWWVARSAFKSASKDGRNIRLHLTDGSEVPVSRSNIGKLKAAGWII